MSTTIVTPNDVEKALDIAPDEYRRMHEMNEDNSLVRGCKLGTVFTVKGEYHIYVGVNGRNRKFPCIAYRVSDWRLRKCTASFFDKIREA